MINTNEILKDPLDDSIGRLLSKLACYQAFTKEKHEVVSQVIKSITKKNHLFFPGQKQNYHISAAGESFIYKVALNKRGYLKQFRGKTIRLICVGSGTRWNREYAAHTL